MATGRSDYPNQINNVAWIPLYFQGALDVKASAINDEMKIGSSRYAPGFPGQGRSTPSVLAAYN
jgi:malate dehydrogenase (oxaloacetate-decarboxylating)(NADP+)